MFSDTELLDYLLKGASAGGGSAYVWRKTTAKNGESIFTGTLVHDRETLSQLVKEDRDHDSGAD